MTVMKVLCVQRPHEALLVCPIRPTWQRIPSHAPQWASQPSGESSVPTPTWLF